MEVAILTDFKKKLNFGFNISFSAFTVLWCFIAVLELFAPEAAAMLIVCLIVASAICLVAAVSAAILNSLLKPAILLKPDNSYILAVNSEKQYDEIKEKKDIEFSGNYIFAEERLKPIAEVNNLEAFRLLHSDFRKFLKVESNKTQTPYIEQSPKALFTNLMDMLWAAP